MALIRLIFCALALGCCVVGWASPASAAAPPEEHETYFYEEVLPILEANCFACHSDADQNGGLRLDTRAHLVSGGELGPAIDLEEPESSQLLQAIRYESLEMPPDGKLPDEEIAVLARWLALGAPYPEEMQGDLEAAEQAKASRGMQVSEADREFWAFQPIRDPEPPAVRDSAWPAGAVDAFIAARLDEAELKPNGAAAPGKLIRRLCYDLTGLPPSPEAVARFEADPSEAAYRKIVDSLLASPEYGERWGRHWLDLVRYAETNSYERDGAKPEVWRYRDYVIDSLNEDKPYDTFVTEQLAGDEMPYAPQRMIATGFYRLGLWDDEPADPVQALYDELDDIVATTGQVFLGLTINCARCHDHKIDPIRQEDYYRMLAFFAGINRYGIRSPETVERFSLRPLMPPDQRREHTEAVAGYRKQRGRLERTIREIENRVKPDLTPVEQEDFRYPENRTRLVAKRAGGVISKAEAESYERAREEFAALERDRPEQVARALVVTEQEEPREAFVHVRGNPHAPGDPVEPGFPEVLGGRTPAIPKRPDSETSGRRRVLAEWIASPDNPLTARVIANRLWQFHFGRGLVRTPNDFGFQGERPTHPELLDYLASRLLESDWHLKPLHRMLVTSRTYRMATTDQPEAAARDPLNDLMWRFDPRRLSAEEIRDSMLAATGRLNLEKGGPSMYPTIEREVLAGQSQPGAGWGESSERERARRSVYIHIKRSLPVPLMTSFDAADTDVTCPVRFATTQPTQALGLMNGRYAGKMADALARRTQRLAGDEIPARVAAALHEVTQRQPSDAEVRWGVELVDQLAHEHGLSRDAALRQFCLVALNLNEFIYLD